MSRTFRTMLTLALLVFATGPLHAQCPDGSPPPCRSARPAPPPPTSIAVLYLDNLSRDSNDLYLAEGITEEIISRLGQVRRLAVKSRYAVRRFRSLTDQDATALGRALGVAHLVTGSIERAGPRLRVRVELVAATSGRHVWGGRFDRADGDVLAIEDEIAQAVAREVTGRLAPAERAVLTARPTVNRDAYDHYLKGNFYLSRRTSAVDGRRALEEYQAALRFDPRFAAAHGRLGLVYGIYASWPWPYPGLDHDSLIALGLAAANRAIALDSASVDGWLARGFVLTPAPVTADGWRGFGLTPGLVAADLSCFLGTARCIHEARRSLVRARALDSTNAEVWYQYGRTFLLDSAGFGNAAFERSLALEPDRAVSAWILGWSYLREHRLSDALRMLDSAIALGRRDVSVYSLRIQARLAAGDIPGVRADLAIAGDLLRPSLPADSIADVVYRSLWVIADARSGDSTAARARLDSLRRRYVPAKLRIGTMLVHLAAAAVAVRDVDEGLMLLEGVPRSQLWFAIRSPLWDPVRSHPRFRRLEHEVVAALPSSSEQHGRSPREGFVRVPGGRVWYRIVGEGPGTPLLVVHGGGGVSSTYLKPLGALGTGRPIIFYDQLGVGRSDRPVDSLAWTIDRYVDELSRVRAALGLQEVHLYGHSWGTILAVEYALTHPEGLRSLILAGPALSMPRYVHDRDSLIGTLPDTLRTILRSQPPGSPAHAGAMLEYYRRYFARRQPWSVDLDSTIRGITREAARRIDRLIFPSYDRTARLGDLALPTLFAVGQFDDATPATARYYQSLVPGSELAVIEEAGHLPMQDEPDRYLGVLRAFLQRVDSSTRAH